MGIVDAFGYRDREFPIFNLRCDIFSMAADFPGPNSECELVEKLQRDTAGLKNTERTSKVSTPQPQSQQSGTLPSRSLIADRITTIAAAGALTVEYHAQWNDEVSQRELLATFQAQDQAQHQAAAHRDESIRSRLAALEEDWEIWKSQPPAPREDSQVGGLLRSAAKTPVVSAAKSVVEQRFAHYLPHKHDQKSPTRANTGVRKQSTSESLHIVGTEQTLSSAALAQVVAENSHTGDGDDELDIRPASSVLLERTNSSNPGNPRRDVLAKGLDSHCSAFTNHTATAPVEICCEVDDASSNDSSGLFLSAPLVPCLETSESTSASSMPCNLTDEPDAPTPLGDVDKGVGGTVDPRRSQGASRTRPSPILQHVKKPTPVGLPPKAPDAPPPTQLSTRGSFNGNRLKRWPTIEEERTPSRPQQPEFLSEDTNNQDHAKAASQLQKLRRACMSEPGPRASNNSRPIVDVSSMSSGGHANAEQWFEINKAENKPKGVRAVMQKLVAARKALFGMKDRKQGNLLDGAMSNTEVPPLPASRSTTRTTSISRSTAANTTGEPRPNSPVIALHIILPECSVDEQDALMATFSSVSDGMMGGTPSSIPTLPAIKSLPSILSPNSNYSQASSSSLVSPAHSQQFSTRAYTPPIISPNAAPAYSPDWHSTPLPDVLNSSTSLPTSGSQVQFSMLSRIPAKTTTIGRNNNQSGEVKMESSLIRFIDPSPNVDDGVGPWSSRNGDLGLTLKHNDSTMKQNDGGARQASRALSMRHSDHGRKQATILRPVPFA